VRSRAEAWWRGSALSDRGDPTSFEAFPSPSREAFNGCCLAIVRGQRQLAGEITLRAESVSLLAAEVSMQSVRQ